MAAWPRYPYERPDKPLRMRISCAPGRSTRTLRVAADCYRQRAHPGRLHIGNLYRWQLANSASVLVLMRPRLTPGSMIAGSKNMSDATGSFVSPKASRHRSVYNAEE